MSRGSTFHQSPEDVERPAEEEGDLGTDVVASMRSAVNRVREQLWRLRDEEDGSKPHG